jgi:Flp pilus assembly protein CpaB
MKNDLLHWDNLDQKVCGEETSPKRQSVFFKKHKSTFKLVSVAFLATVVQYVCVRSCDVNQAQKNQAQYAVVVTTKPILKGDILSESNTKLAYLGIGESKKSFLLNSEFRSYLGHKVKIDLDDNTPIIKNAVMRNDQDMSLPEKIPQGKRFYSLEADLSTIASILKVGDKVDIIAHMNIKDYGNATETILSRVKIIGIGSDFQENTSNPQGNTLSFYLTPDEVKIISFMKSYSQFTVVIRNPNDIDQEENDPITFNKFIQNEKIQKIFQSDSFRIIQGEKIR